jgi:DNA-binding Lrp family transcriptional regulator
MTNLPDKVDIDILKGLEKGRNYRTLKGIATKSDGRPYTSNGIFRRTKELTKQGYVKKGTCSVCGHRRVPQLTDMGKKLIEDHEQRKDYY